ncbi:MAG: phospholipid carrier-dependent glycosyltransferase [Dehalococcoidales bacterium]|nr:phospholipid carrier-dependent glycosyltransferase [Dehalococcoidales bacterium]
MEVPIPENYPAENYCLKPEQLIEAPRRSMWYKILHWEYLPLSAIIIVTLVFHALSITRPPTIVWDEVWYVTDARSIVRGAGDMRQEHPALAKLFIVAGELIFNGFANPEADKGVILTEPISSNDLVLKVNDASLLSGVNYIRIEDEQLKIENVDVANNEIRVASDGRHFGTVSSGHEKGLTVYMYTDNAIGWRFFSIIFGTINIILIYFICKKLQLSWKASVAAAFLMSFDNMTFLHSGLALLDVYQVTFLLAGFLLYLHSKYLSTGVAFALSACCKLVGVFGLIAVAAHWLVFRRDKWPWAVGSVVIAAVAFVFFTILFDYFITGQFVNPVDRIKDLMVLSSINKFTDPPLSISSRPWTWLYPFIFPYTNAIVYSYDPQYVSFISWTIQFLIVPVFIYWIIKAMKGNAPARFALMWFFGTYLLWMSDVFTNRVTFVFYFLPTTPVICIGLGMAFSDIMDRLRAKRYRLGRVTPGMKASYAGIIFYFLLHAVIFIIFNPAIPTIIKTWLPPFYLGITITSTVTLNQYCTSMLSSPHSWLNYAGCGLIGIGGWCRKYF